MTRSWLFPALGGVVAGVVLTTAFFSAMTPRYPVLVGDAQVERPARDPGAGQDSGREGQAQRFRSATPTPPDRVGPAVPTPSPSAPAEALVPDPSLGIPGDGNVSLRTASPSEWPSRVWNRKLHDEECAEVLPQALSSPESLAALPPSSKRFPDHDCAPPDARVWPRVLTVAVTVKKLEARAIKAHRAWGKGIPGLVWVMDQPAPDLEAIGARVHVLKHAFDAEYNRMTERMLDIFAAVREELMEPHHDWVLRVWDDNVIWRPGLERQILSLEARKCCSPDKALIGGARPFVFLKHKGIKFPFLPGGAPWLVSRGGMERLFGSEPWMGPAAAQFYKDYAKGGCNDQHLPKAVCQAAEDVLLSILAMRSGVHFEILMGAMVHSPFSWPEGQPKPHPPALPWQERLVSCRLPDTSNFLLYNSAPDVWSYHYVDADDQRMYLDLLRGGCEDDEWATFHHSRDANWPDHPFTQADRLDISQVLLEQRGGGGR